MPTYQVKCKKCGRKHEFFTQTSKQGEAAFRGLDFICPTCDTKMERVIFPSHVDMEGRIRKT